MKIKPVLSIWLGQRRVAAAAAVAAIALCAVATPLSAAEYKTVQADRSRIAFKYQQMGVAMDGRFPKFSSQVRFDTNKPQSASVRIEVDLASIDTGSAEGDEEVAGKSWFNIPAFPKALFVSKSITPVATWPGEFRVTGDLSIKGKSREVAFPIRLAPGTGPTATITGGFTIKRADFAIGEGSWSKFDVVGNDVQVQFSIVAAQ